MLFTGRLFCRHFLKREPPKVAGDPPGRKQLLLFIIVGATTGYVDNANTARAEKLSHKTPLLQLKLTLRRVHSL